MTEHIGVSSGTVDRLVFDAGAIYRDYGEDSEELIGATRGGATWNVEREDREIEIDGPIGFVKGLRRTITLNATLEVAFLEYDRQLWLDMTRGTATSDGTHETIQPDTQIVDSDYYTNITLVADVSGSSDPCLLQLDNAIAHQEWDISTEHDDEAEMSVTFAAHYDPSSLDTAPWSIMWPVSLS